MSKSKRRSTMDDEFKPSSGSKKAKKKQSSPSSSHSSTQPTPSTLTTSSNKVSLNDLVQANLLKAGTEVFVKDQYGIITEKGTIKVQHGHEFLEYHKPTSWTREATGRVSGGWSQIRLTSDNTTLSVLKDKYLRSLANNNPTNNNEEETITRRPLVEGVAHSSDEIPLPLNVRFPSDENKVFKIIWVNNDYSQFSIEYQGQVYDLPEFVARVTDGEELRFDQLLYESAPGKWTKLGSLLHSATVEDTSFQERAAVAPVDQMVIDNPKSAASNNTEPNNNTFSTIANNNNNSNPTFSTNNYHTHTNTNTSTSMNAYGNNYTHSNEFVQTPSLPTFSNNSHLYNVLVNFENENVMPARINTYANSWQEVQFAVTKELGDFPNLDLFDFKLFDEEFKIFVRIPKDFANFPHKCRLIFNKKSVILEPAITYNNSNNNINNIDTNNNINHSDSHNDIGVDGNNNSNNAESEYTSSPSPSPSLSTTNAYTNTDAVTMMTTATSSHEEEE